MNPTFANRMNEMKPSFIREILKVIENPEIISFAGGLPNPASFPVEGLKEATIKVLEDNPAEVLQYSTTEGYLPLRQFIAKRYLEKKNIVVDPSEILITTGSQQALDLIGKIFLDRGDSVLMERPGYLGAIQSLSMYEPIFQSVTVNENGLDTEELKAALAKNDSKFFYSAPNFQNPSGISYTADKKVEIADILKDYPTLFIEDDPYGELRFSGEDVPSMWSYLPEQTILLGSFSKIVSPALRMGWVVAKPTVMQKLVVAKQAADLHTNYFSQRLLAEYLKNSDLDAHIQKIRDMYGAQCKAMLSAMDEYFPSEVTYTRPEGGMFIWATLPEHISAMELFNRSIENNVAFVPGDPFYTDLENVNTLRLNYTNCNEETIVEGIKRLAAAIKEML